MIFDFFSSRFDGLLREFREALANCRDLYVSAGEACVQDHPHLIKKNASDFVHMMDDLHRGLLVKIFVTISEADRRWSANERQLAEALFDHVWHQEMTGDALREAILKVSSKSAQLKWYSLVRPFDEIAPLRDHIAELETIVLRVANIVAKADDDDCEKASERVGHIQDELARHFRPIPIDAPSQHTQAHALGGQAIAAVQQQAKQVRKEYKLAEPIDEQESEQSREERLAEALAELDSLIGLDSIKHEVRTLINFLKVQDQRKQMGLPATQLSLHMVFAGNPGTGKTTVARIVGKVYGALGILSKGHLVETDRAGLVAEYAGQTGPKANATIDEALDGVLFVDEAYSLIAKEGDDPFGREAVQALLKRMEDDRDRLVVILAGYPDEMESLLKSNPGLSSRFGRQLTFEDYAPVDLGCIFGKLCAANHYELPKLARVKLMLGLKWLHENRDKHFGNGRMVRNLFEHAIRRLANRIATVTELTRRHLTEFTDCDIDFDPVDGDGIAGDCSTVPVPLLEKLDDDTRRFRIDCPGCNQRMPLLQENLTRRVKCRCGERFAAEWADPE